MTTLASSALSNSLAGPSQAGPASQSSSPASPTATFSNAQQAALGAAAKTHAHLRSASRPSTPTTINGASSSNINSSAGGPSLEAPAGMAYADFLASWGDAHVARWLGALDPHGKCAAHAAAFRAADVRGGVLLELDQPSLKEIGVTSIGDRIRILNAVKALRVRCSARHAHAHTSGLGPGHNHGPGSSVSSITSSSAGSVAMNTISYPSPKLTVTNADSADAFPRQHQRSRSRPAPLQLRSTSQTQNDLPRLIRDPVSVPDSARSMTPLRPLPLPNNQTQSQVGTPIQSQPVSSHSHSSSGSGSGGGSRPHLPPLPPPPRTQPPLPPTSGTSGRGQAPRVHALQQSGGRRTPTQTEPPPHHALPPVPAQQSSQNQTQNQNQQNQNQNQNSATAQTPTQAQNPVLLTPSSSTSTGGWKGEYGLPSGPRSGTGPTATSRAASPLPGLGRRSPGGASTHTKAPSYSVSSNTPALKAAPRPNTSGGHPYANASAGGTSLQPPQSAASLALSPIAESFLNQSGLSTPVPPTAGSSSSSISTNPNASSYHVGRGPFRPSTPSSHQGSSAPSLDELRRRLVRFRLADDSHSSTVNVTECSDGVEVLERVLRRFGKLGSLPGNVTGVSEVDSDEGGLCIDGWTVYLDWGDEGPRKPLREAELLSLCSAGPDHPVRQHGLVIKRTGKPKRSKALQHIFGDSGSSSTSGSQSPHSPITSNAAAQDDDQYLGSSSVAFPRTLTPNQERERERERERELRNMKRASSISVLSGLGVRDPERILDSSESPALATTTEKSGGKSPSASSFAGKIRTFLGARPPSELIATHLPAYFPYTQPKVLRRTVRQSMRFSSTAGLGRRDSAMSMGMQNARRASRMSTATRASMALDTRPSSMASLPPPPVPDKNRMSIEESDREPPRMSISTEDGQSIDLRESEDEDGKDDGKSPATPHLLPPVNFPSESFADSFHSVTGDDSGARSGPTPLMSRTPSAASRASRRFSTMSELRGRRDRSDTASMLTVDEITAEVELNRRKSLAASVRSGESGSAAAAATVNTGETTLIEDGEESPKLEDDDDNYEMVGDDDESEIGIDVEDDDTLDGDEEEFEEDEEEVMAEEDEDAPVKSTGGKRGAKWIRGALIGAGSFGSVYLGMDAMNGLLMAVKQVELPSGSGPNEQRKKSMLDALEHEIDLLRELQHDNIVQYLDSSSDDTHLNIFLEYVPGGSVTALLRNYGAFEEALCRHFVRQILQGLEYLHSKEIIHRDIKGANILVDNKGGIKISDFGISKKVEETFLGGGARAHRPSLQGSVYWMAPEVVKQVAHTRKADIWSVGCLVVEMLTGNHPYPTLNQMQAIFKIGSSAKPTIPSDISPEAEDFLSKTFETKYESRPDADELLQHPWIVNGPSSNSPSTGAAKTTKTKSSKSA